MANPNVPTSEWLESMAKKCATLGSIALDWHTASGEWSLTMDTLESEEEPKHIREFMTPMVPAELNDRERSTVESMFHAFDLALKRGGVRQKSSVRLVEF